MFCHKQLWHSFIFHFIPTGALKMLFWPTAKECRRSCNCYTQNTKPKKITTSNWIEREWLALFIYVAANLGVCLCMFLFLNEISLWFDFLSGHFNFHASSFVFFFVTKKRKKMNENPNRLRMLYNWNSKYWNVHWFPCASIAGQEPIDWIKTQIEVKCWS